MKTWSSADPGKENPSLAGEYLVIDPCIPRGWKEDEIQYRMGQGVYAIRVENPDGVNRGVKEVIVDGEMVPDGKIPLREDGRQHEIRVVMG